MNFYINEVIKETSTEEKFRILWVDSNQIILYMIQLNEEKAVPIKKSISELREAIIINEWIKEREINSTFLTNDYEQKHIEIRDKAWLIIKDMVNREPEIFDKKLRSGLIKSTCEQHSIDYKTVRKYLYKYWSRGKTINALLPDYNKSGAKGKDRSSGEKKRGRPSKYGIDGINIDENTKKIFKVAVKKHYLSSKQNSLTDAYKFMLKEFYAENIYFENGVERVILKDENSIPTIGQFKYWYQKEYDAPEILKARKGEKRFNKDHRAVLGNSLSEVFGPGSRYQIDATIGDIYLVSEVNRDWIIGRPVIYLVVDVFSRMVVGMYIGLEGPSWTGATMAIKNIITDKKDYCAEYGIQIEEEQWPCNHLPEILLADKGEFEGYNVDRLVKAFNLHVENTASFRADWKGIVERKFRTIQTKVKPLLPGYIDIDFKERGAKDYRLDATLTLKEFNQIMIKQVLNYNTKHYMNSYVRDRDLVADSVLPIPLELWNWGIHNRTGKLKFYPENDVMMHLLPSDTATVNYKGIQFKGITYKCDKALEESWFENARMKGSWKINLSYDRRNMNHVYFINEDNGEVDICYMVDSSKRYSGLSLDEINYWRAEEKRLSKKQNHSQLQKDIDFYSEVEAIVKNASKEIKEEKDISLSKAERVGSITEKRQLEKKRQYVSESTPLIAKEFKENKIIPLKLKNDNNVKRSGVRDFLKRRKDEQNE
ncbi:transposase [Solibacillus silvestris StLB046]|uniref:Transposase n=1 Tax=Solibacillus silvestris (strain StLB046) TaxID=1002809 RepID=F2F4G2_SOLSS|nr:Mu transposase C-terminal domain-containing protein [Solibacillus silvestris]BAK14696.1 transposase [Solibacillus silvestris StLB046]